jgi:DNA-binding GntR family transcriptional regulator
VRRPDIQRNADDRASLSASVQRGKGRRADLIYKALFNAILARQLLPNTKLSEETIGDFFGVSRTVIRAVLNQLMSVCLVELRQNRGAFVVNPTVEESLHVFQARKCIEVDICNSLPDIAKADDIRALRAHLEKERAAYRSDDSVSIIILSGEFHMMLAQIAGNQVLLRFLRELISRTSLILSAHAHGGPSKCGLDEHIEIVDALEARDLERLRTAMRTHLDEIINTTSLERPPQQALKLEDILSRFAH